MDISSTGGSTYCCIFIQEYRMKVIDSRASSRYIQRPWVKSANCTALVSELSGMDRPATLNVPRIGGYSYYIAVEM